MKEEHTVKLLTEEEAVEYGKKWAKELKKLWEEGGYTRQRYVPESQLDKVKR